MHTNSGIPGRPNMGLDTTVGDETTRSPGAGRRQRRFRAPALVLLPLLVAGCELTVAPTETVAPEQAISNLTGVQALLTGVYGRLQAIGNYANEMLFLPEALADNTSARTPANSFPAHHRNEVGSHMGGWNARYQAINEANFAIAAAEALTGDDAIRNRIVGEALFLRALNYFDLARIYAYEPNGVMGDWDRGLVLRTDPTRTSAEAEPRERASVAETYARIEEDLLRSIQLLAEGDRGSPFFAGRGAAQALLARVYLYWERWDDAAIQATGAIQGSRGRLATPSEYVGMWASAPNVESIFEINYNAATESVWVNSCQACYVHPSGTWNVSVVPSRELLALFEPGDARLAAYPAVPSGTGGVPAGTRYTAKFGNYRGANTDNVPVIRFSELLLIRAEARAMGGLEAEAREDLNRLRAARTAAPLSSSGSALIADILDERRRELAFEGHRFFDLKRRRMDIPKPAVGNNPMIPYTDFRILAGLPSTEVLNNPLLAQNPGY